MTLGTAIVHHWGKVADCLYHHSDKESPAKFLQKVEVFYNWK